MVGNFPLPQSKRPLSTIHAAEGGAVAAEELGGGVDDDVRPVLDRPDQVRGAQGGVDDERDAASCATFASPARSWTSEEGLATTSTKIALVLSRTAAA